MSEKSYNGHVLPVIPERDEQAHPNAYIAIRSSNTYLCYFTATELHADSDGTVIFVGTGPKYKLVDGEWVEFTSIAYFLELVWANVDVYYKDNLSDETLAGTLYMEKSPDPVPVDPPAVAPEVEPKAFMVGSWMGQIVKCYGIGI